MKRLDVNKWASIQKLRELKTLLNPHNKDRHESAPTINGPYFGIVATVDSGNTAVLLARLL